MPELPKSPLNGQTPQITLSAYVFMTFDTPPITKKTRDLPTLSQCHSCNIRIDLSDGKNKLQTLYSEWRIVLLCKKCFYSVESSQICSYCFGIATQNDDESFRCCICNRLVHRKCFSDCKGIAPLLFSCSGSVCIDCWVPKPLASWRSVLKSNRKARRKRVRGDSSPTIKALEDAVRDANSAAEEKTEAAAKARQKAEEKAAVARKALDLAANALEFLEGSIDDDGEFPRIWSGNSVNLDNVKDGPSECGAKCDVEDGRFDVALKEGEGSCSIKLMNFCGDDNAVDFESHCLCKEEGSTKTVDRGCEWKLDRYFFKYRKRKANDRYYFLKYSKRRRRLNAGEDIDPTAFHSETQKSTAGLLLNCSEDSKKYTTATVGFCAIPLQTSACVGHLSWEPS